MRLPRDLAGKRIAINAKGNFAQLEVTAGFQQYGVKIPESGFVEVAYPQMEVALKNGSVDAALAIEPFFTVTGKARGARMVPSRIRLANHPSSVSRDRLQRVADLMLQYGYLDSRFDAGSLLLGDAADDVQLRPVVRRNADAPWSECWWSWRADGRDRWRPRSSYPQNRGTYPTGIHRRTYG